jgi:hypothetical protein
MKVVFNNHEFLAIDNIAFFKEHWQRQQLRPLLYIKRGVVDTCNTPGVTSSLSHEVKTGENYRNAFSGLDLKLTGNDE